MDAGNQLMSILIALTVWGTLSMVIIILTRRHIKIGLKIWFYKKLGKEPVLIRYHGPNKRVREMVIPTKNIHDTIEIAETKFFIFKSDKGETFFLDQAAMRQRDDDINEIQYNHNSIMPADLSLNEQMVIQYQEKWLTDMEKYKEEHTVEGFAPVDVELMIKYTDPARLNEWMKLTYLVAKAQALRDAASWEKWVKIGAFAAIGAGIIGIILYYKLDGKVLPLLEQVAGNINAIAMGVKANLGGTVAT